MHECLYAELMRVHPFWASYEPMKQLLEDVSRLNVCHHTVYFASDQIMTNGVVLVAGLVTSSEAVGAYRRTSTIARQSGRSSFYFLYYR